LVHSLFYRKSIARIFHSFGDSIIASEGLQNLKLCSALISFEKEGIFIGIHQLQNGTSLLLSHPKTRPLSQKRQPILSPLTKSEGWGLLIESTEIDLHV
jgi:hypothetical protein